MKSVLDKQTAHLESIESVIKQDKLIQLTQAVLQAKTDKDIIQEREESNDHLKGIKEHSKKTADQIADLVKSMKDQVNLLKKKDLSAVSAKALSMEVTKGPKNIKELMFGTKQENKDFKTIRGFLDQAGFVSKGSGSRMDTFLGNREAKDTFVNNRMKRNPTMLNNLYGGNERKLRKDLGNQYDKNNDTITAIQENDKEFKKLESAGFDSSDKRNSALFKPLAEEKEKLSAKLEKDDVRFRQAKQETAVKETVKEKKVKAEESASEFSYESSLENERRQEESVRLLTLIEENTRDKDIVATTQRAQEDGGGGGGLLDGIMSMMGTGIMKAFKFLFNPRFLLKALTKVFVPAMIIGSMINGIVDAFKAFFNGGSFSDVIIAGLGGVLKVLTFGLFDAQTVKKIVSVISGFVTDYIIEPIKNFMGFVGKAFDTYIKEPIMGAFELIGNLFAEYIVDPIKKFFEPISAFFSSIKNQVFGFLQNFGIPEISFTIPLINKKVSIGPFYPFAQNTESFSSPPANEKQNSQSTAAKLKDSTETTSSSYIKIAGERFEPGQELSKKQMAVIQMSKSMGNSYSPEVEEQYKKQITAIPEKNMPTTGTAVYNQSAQNSEAAAKSSNTSQPIIVSAPTTNNTTKQSIAMPAPVRNEDSGFNKYINRSAFAF
jgi:hypothetical protein